MKRSEALKQIQALCSSYGAVTPNQLAKKILDKLEHLGIKPPFYEDPFDRSLGESSVYVKNYKWEPEDETK